MQNLSAKVGQIPFNFRVGQEAYDEIKFHKPHSPEGELEVRLDTCKGPVIATLPLRPAVANDAVTELPAVHIDSIEGLHDLCYTFTQWAVDPMWTLKSVNLQ